MTDKVHKTIMQITILHPFDEAVDGEPLAYIAFQIDEGGWLGRSVVVYTTPVPHHEVEAECMALGNDGSFFEEGDQ